jgi:hypothetical protein
LRKNSDSAATGGRRRPDPPLPLQPPLIQPGSTVGEVLHAPARAVGILSFATELFVLPIHAWVGGSAKAFGLDDGPTHAKAAIVKGKPLAMPPKLRDSQVESVHSFRSSLR